MAPALADRDLSFQDSHVLSGRGPCPSVYARFGRIFGDRGSTFREVGMLLKYPIDLDEL